MYVEAPLRLDTAPLCANVTVGEAVRKTSCACARFDRERNLYLVVRLNYGESGPNPLGHISCNVDATMRSCFAQDLRAVCYYNPVVDKCEVRFPA
jgi:hypothetical protein